MVGLWFFVLVLVAFDGFIPLEAALAPHGWDCISCPSNSMLAGNWDVNNPNFNNTDLWWAETITSSYAAVALNMNFANTSITVEQARIMKKLNPHFKFLVYQNSELGPLTKESKQIIDAHPEWWCRDDDDVPLSTVQGYKLNMSRADVRSWYNNYPLHVFGEDAEELLDGLLSDSMGYSPGWLKNTNQARYDAFFQGKMKLGDEGRAIYSKLNGGEVWANDALDVIDQYNKVAYNHSLVKWNTALDHVDVGFLEGAGSFWYDNHTTGEWIPEFFELFLESVINASTAGKTVVLHFSPGPSMVPLLSFPQNATPAYNKFLALTWQGPAKTPLTADGVRQAAADVLVQALAPFLIVANERVFLQYAWFYELQDGNIPCPSGIECGMPSSWYPEFSKPLGAPKAPAVKNGPIWTRAFANAEVYVDVRSRSASKITWHS